MEEDDSEKIPLSQLKGKSQPEGKGAGDNEEMGDSEIEWLVEVHKKVIEEAWACNLKLAQKCYEEVGKIQSFDIKGWAQRRPSSSNSKKGGRTKENPLLQARDKGSDEDKEIPKICGIPHQKASIPEIGVRDSTRFQNGSMLHGRCYLHLARSQQGILSKSDRRWKSLYHPQRKNYNLTEGFQLGDASLRMHGRSSSLCIMQQVMCPCKEEVY